jgi:lambda family phage portal protein
MGRKRLAIQRNLLDKAYEYVSPVKAAERMRARMTLAVAGAYTGSSTSRRSMSKWDTGSGDADSDTLYDLAKLRSRSRDLIRNNPISVGAINTNITNVIGTGLKLQSRINRNFLGISDEEASAWESNVEREFKLWSESKDCDITRTLNFYELQELAFRSSLENGDCFILLPYISRLNMPYDLRVQIIEADRVANQNYASDTEFLAGGIRKDESGAPIEYHIIKGHPGNIWSTKKLEWIVVPAFGDKTGRRNVIHLFKTLRVNQSRGIPYLAPVIESLKQLGTYTDSEAMAAVVTSMFTVFVKSASGDADLMPMTPTDDVGGSTSDEDFKLGSGAIIGLNPDEDISIANPMRPNPAFDPFVQAILRQIGVALELPFEVLIKHFTASYSAARSSLLEAWKFFSVRREWLANNFCRPIYEAWLTEAIMLGRIPAPGFVGGDPSIQAAYFCSEWIGPSPGQIDPLKEIQAAQERINLGISTLSRETAALTGEEWESTYQQIVKERKMIEKNDGIASSAVPPQPAQPNFSKQPAKPNIDQSEEDNNAFDKNDLENN